MKLINDLGASARASAIRGIVRVVGLSAAAAQAQNTAAFCNASQGRSVLFKPVGVKCRGKGN
jgi:hypothetical protein